MKLNPIPVIAALLLLPCSLEAQNDPSYNLSLRSGEFIPEKNITAERLNQFNDRASRLAGITFAIIQFEQIPSSTEREQLRQSGIELLDYIPNNAYTVTISGVLSADILTQVNARAVINLSAEQKMQPELAKGIYPSWAIKSAGTVDVWISFPKTFSFEEVQQELRKKNYQVISDQYKNYRIIAIRVPVHLLRDLALLPYIEYVQAAPASDKTLNYNSMFAARANILKASLANGGRDLSGQGVVVGVGDNGDVQTHLDFTNRLINRAGRIPLAHATHVAGTVGGAGIIDELFTGYASKSTLIGQIFSGIISYAPNYVQDHGMVIANSSFGSVTDDCAYNGLYDMTARILDQQAFDLPELQHVFAAGNDGIKNCSPYPLGFKNVLGGYQSAKNIICVGSTDYKRDLSAFSSKGPVRDGRLKPEIMSMGQLEASTWVNNLYSYNDGTSMAAPGVSGGLALLVQRYRQLNSNANPKNGLLKALICNGGEDRGNAGPDFSYGFGSMNLLRSVKMMENVTYFNTTVTQGGMIPQLISVPAGTAQLKVLLYWNDPAAAVMASKTLVNDLDLQVDSSGTTILPLKLDTLPVNVNNIATRNADHFNNIEQVIINNPAPGNYTLKVLGTIIAQGPSQEYFLVYDMIPQSLELTNPVGGERLVPYAVRPDPFYIQWDSYSDEVNTFTVEFFDGTSWNTLSNNVSASSRLYSYQLPNISTDAARVRVSKNNTAYTQTSNSFTIAATTTVSLDAVQCEGYIKINWTAVTGATDYEVMSLQGSEMVSVATTAGLTYTFSGLSKDSTYWVTVRPRINGNPGRRALAIARQPNNGTCANDISDNDLKVDAIISPASSGRLFTSTALSNGMDVTIRIKNLDNVVSSGDITVSYTVNGTGPAPETITTPIADIAPGGFIDHTFSVDADLLAAGTYSIMVTATKASDPVTANNSITKVFKQLTNPAFVNGDLPWLDNLETAATQTVTTDQMGLTGRDRYDFVNSTADGRLRTFFNSGIAYSGSKAITLDMTRYVLAGNIDSLTGTFNLENFSTADELRLDFRYKNHGQKTDAANRVWIRGADDKSWIQAYDLFANQPNADGSYKLSGSLELNDLLIANAQLFTSSFQVRWGQWGQFMAADNESGGGYTFDDIRIYRAVDDIQMISIDAPTTLSCNLGSAETVSVTVRNSANAAINNIPIVLRVDGSIVATEMITLPIPANSSAPYTFNPATANLSAPGIHTIEVWVEYPTDNVRDNDTARITVNSLPYINTFPYLQNFEVNNGYWYTTSIGSSWQYGTPNSPKVRRGASGSKAWKTNLTGYYDDGELSYLYSPCFNLSGMTTPTLSFSLTLDIEDCGAVFLCDAAWMEYSTDGGTVWSKLGTMGQGTNWYNRDYGGNHVWSQQDYTRWHVATTALPTSNNSNTRFRFVFDSDGSVKKDGIAVDDIHIYDNVNGIYDGVTMGSPVMQTINGGEGWVNFIQSGKLVAAVNSPVAMGATGVQAYINTGTVRINSDQYYHDRNITIKPATVNLPDSASVRFYFLDSETETLINATGCAYCFKPSMAYELGVTKYSDPVDANENGTLADNTPGLYSFITSANTKMVPFDKGYYAEFKVKDFSEFWLNNGGFNFSTPLPLQLLSFTAKKHGANNVLAEWVTANESNVDHFDIELAKGNSAYQQNQFVKIGEVKAIGNSTTELRYSFTDLETNKNGVRYYRLKIVDNDGRYTYSAIRSVVFSNDVLWQVYPNPSSGQFSFIYQASDGTALNLKLYDVNGRVVKQYQAIATGFEQKMRIDLTETAFSAGLYLMEVTAGDMKQTFRLIKQ